MSLVIDAMEHLRVTGNRNENEAAYVAVETMRGQLGALAALVLLGEANIWEMKLIADGKMISYESKKIDDDFQQVLVALSNAEEIDLSISYDYQWRAGWQMYELMGPCVLQDRMAEFEKDELNGIFYSSWYHEDCTESTGTLIAYGENNGKFYHGTVDFEDVQEIPAGRWDALHTAILIETEDDFDTDAHPDLVNACQAFKELSDDIELDTVNGLLFFLNNITIDSEEKGKRFCEMAKNLLEALPDDCDILINGFFADQWDKDPKLMIIDADEHNDVIIKVARV